MTRHLRAILTRSLLAMPVHHTYQRALHCYFHYDVGCEYAMSISLKLRLSTSAQFHDGPWLYDRSPDSSENYSTLEKVARTVLDRSVLALVLRCTPCMHGTPLLPRSRNQRPHCNVRLAHVNPTADYPCIKCNPLY